VVGLEQKFPFACVGQRVQVRTADIHGDAKCNDTSPNGKIVPRAVFIYWWTAVKVTQAPGDQRPTQPNLSNVGHLSPTLLSTSNNKLSVCRYMQFGTKRIPTKSRH
jgi:hypothetical protein